MHTLDICCINILLKLWTVQIYARNPTKRAITLLNEGVGVHKGTSKVFVLMALSVFSDSTTCDDLTGFAPNQGTSTVPLLIPARSIRKYM